MVRLLNKMDKTLLLLTLISYIPYENVFIKTKIFKI